MPSTAESTCSIARSLGVLGERWALLILRDAFEGISRFADFRESLGVASDVLTARLTALVDHGVLERVEYREPGERRRSAYVLTPAGRELLPVLAALQQWGDRHVAPADGPSLLRRHRRTGEPLRVAFVDERGREVDADEVAFVPTPTYPAERLRAHEARRVRQAGAGMPLEDRVVRPGGAT